MVLVGMLAACRDARPSPPPATPDAAAVDIAAMRALLARYSPAGERIVAAYEAMPTRFEIGGATVQISPGAGFAAFFDDAEPYHHVDDLSTAVHEVYHAYSALTAYQLLAARGLAPGAGAMAVDTDGTPILVLFTATYPAREMDASFPAEGRTQRYRVYVSPSQPSQSSQVSGVFGLLDELVAYFHSARTIVDLWPWVRDEAPDDRTLLIDYLARLHEIWVPFAELELFVLHYVEHAAAAHPDVERALRGSDGFRRALAAVDRDYRALLARAADLEPEVVAFARGRGVDAVLAGGTLTVDGTPVPGRDAGYDAVVGLLESEHYRALREGLVAPAPPP